MIDKDVVYEKINRIQNCLQRIYSTLDGDVSRLDNYDTQDIITLNLQRAVQLLIDLAAHVVRAKSFGMPQTLKENFQILHHNGIIDKDLKEKMEHMVGFRNIAVHDYESINPEILKSIVKNHLKDIEDFYTILLSKIS
ncbi:MAG: DUF86 domain-containing protein [Verrucomicrobia bacterium]|nr:DUF86 domain-containing protein [Verrucomicrobiota bacterium]MBS0637936.1 DUF86 domain-containing protein [Verrucomicrobiota bacterium]